ncbi:MAG: glycosyltransferase family 4 protein [Deltaproteobacteria bacterium]|nr:glycosyltransferase family 4 protein [Deltaproteobacteria bacterium]
MIVAMPTGVAHGWGIAGQHLIEQIYRLPPIPDVTLHSMNNPDFEPSFPDMWNKVNVGYCFFENDIEAYRHLKKASEMWDFIVAGSGWCEHHLRLWGVERTATVLQGIDPGDFHQLPPRVDDGRFIVFSGGKFELRKSQDIVIAAMKVFMERHRDAWLSCAWHNQWPFSVATMSGSPFIRFAMEERPCEEIFLTTLERNGIDPTRVMLQPMMPNTAMREVYRESDIGLFPNRCEGGNNMVMSEYMACGRAVIASDKTGHGDVITSDNAFALDQYTIRMIERNGQPSALWFEPSVDEVVEQLEFAYRHRDDITRKADHAAIDLKKLDWKQAAHHFFDIASQVAPGVRAVSADDYRLRAEGLLKAERPEGAMLQLREALALSPLDSNVHRELGDVFIKLGCHNEAAYHHHKAAMLKQFARR